MSPLGYQVEAPAANAIKATPRDFEPSSEHISAMFLNRLCFSDK